MADENAVYTYGLDLRQYPAKIVLQQGETNNAHLLSVKPDNFQILKDVLTRALSQIIPKPGEAIAQQLGSFQWVSDIIRYQSISNWEEDALVEESPPIETEHKEDGYIDRADEVLKVADSCKDDLNPRLVIAYCWTALLYHLIEQDIPKGPLFWRARTQRLALKLDGLWMWAHETIHKYAKEVPPGKQEEVKEAVDGASKFCMMMKKVWDRNVYQEQFPERKV